jgi:hypothetical protein
MSRQACPHVVQRDAGEELVRAQRATVRTSVARLPPLRPGLGRRRYVLIGPGGSGGPQAHLNRRATA